MGRNKWPDNIIIHHLRRDTLNDYGYYLSSPGQLLRPEQTSFSIDNRPELTENTKVEGNKNVFALDFQMNKNRTMKTNKFPTRSKLPWAVFQLRLLPVPTAFTTPAGGSVEHCCCLQGLFPHKGQTTQWLGSRILNKAEVNLKQITKQTRCSTTTLIHYIQKSQEV